MLAKNGKVLYRKQVSLFFLGRQQGPEFLFVGCLRVLGEIDTPKSWLSLYELDANLDFARRHLSTPGNFALGSFVLPLQHDNRARFNGFPQPCQARAAETDIEGVHERTGEVRFLLLTGESDSDYHLAAVACALFDLGHVAEGPV